MELNRFSQNAREAIEVAQTVVRRGQGNQLGTEHLLLGLLAQGEGVVHRVFGELGLDLGLARRGPFPGGRLWSRRSYHRQRRREDEEHQPKKLVRSGHHTKPTVTVRCSCGSQDRERSGKQRNESANGADTNRVVSSCSIDETVATRDS
jgi:hypothetical protein